MEKNLFLILIFLFLSFSYAQQPTARNMFEISTRPWLYYLSQKYRYKIVFKFFSKKNLKQISQNITQLSQIPQSELVANKENGFEIG